ncbi:fibrillin-1-like [Culex pipiens pallens]|uniref:fibrillin-1-like n=1 Tax=Culex pipiens pallens TaxID=42434 RepID=UPI001952B2C3|nr:fibrillin-1-like [Culex pipiens pallens]
MKASNATLLAILLALTTCASFSTAKTDKRQLKDVQLKIPQQIPARRLCTDDADDCVETCPIDYDIDPKKRYCRYKRASCPPNYIRRQGSCVLADVQCPPGSVRQGNRCVVKSFECPSGYLLEGTNCVNSKYCPNGFHWENGFCYQQQRQRENLQMCPHGYEVRNGICIQICVNCDAACAECEEEVAPLSCPSGFNSYRGKCLKILQGRAEVVLRNITYKVPVECDDEEIYSDGSCISYKYDPIRCSSGHFYNGKCVEVAKCSRGSLQKDCECVVEHSVPATCRQGQSRPVGCVTGKAQCRKPAQLINEACVRKVDTHKAFCSRGNPSGDVFCEVGTPQCPSGFTLEGSYCKKNHSYSLSCGRQQLENGWCTSDASCDYGYKLYNNSGCIKESNVPESLCPQSTTYDGEHCVSNVALCSQGLVYESQYGMCIRCAEKSVVCDETAGFRLREGVCVRYEPLCPADYRWETNHCVRDFYQECTKGHLYENYCIDSHLRCPDGYELKDNVCIKEELPGCPEGSMFQNGFCTTNLECPEGYNFGPNSCIQETRTPLNSTSKPSCPADYHYENGICIRTIWRNATIENRTPECTNGYRMEQGRCTKDYYGVQVCPPKTIHMNEENSCFCKVDLICPPRYERIGDECIFRSSGYYSPYLNFLNPCYGMQCGLQYCLSQCFSPPCPFQLCSFGAHQQLNPMYIGNIQQTPDQCGIGGEACIEEELSRETIVRLICPPGYNRENGTCVAYYERICQSGYKMKTGRCVRTDQVKALCPLGFAQLNETCVRIQCDFGYAREGTSCKKIEYRSTIPCPKNYVLLEGFCILRSECSGGSIEAGSCVRRQYAPSSCPLNFLIHNNTCIAQGFCTVRDMFLTDHVCRSRASLQLVCPAGTKRVRNLCIYPEVPKCKQASIMPTNCTGRIERGDLCAYIETPSCNRGYILKEGKCILCSAEKPYCPPDMVIVDGKCVKYRVSCKNGMYLNKQGHCTSIDTKQAACQQGKLCSGKCIHELPSCKSDYMIDGDVCMTNEVTIATCSNGMLRDGRCVEMIQCKEHGYTLTNGWCIRDESNEPTCSSKTTRVRDQCVNGVPKCPENHFNANGHCYASQVQPAECAGGGKCLDNFCHITYPSCNSLFEFDGSVCKTPQLSGPKCPVGTVSDPNDRSYCLYSSEHADFLCASEYYYKNGICQKRQYGDASCPSGYRRKGDLCVRRSCNSASLTNYCLTIGSTQTSFRPPEPQPHFVAQDSTSHMNPTNHANSPQGEKCCHIYSPRICQKDEISQEWTCYHTEHERCGAFCTEPDQRIYLQTSRSYNLDGKLILFPAAVIADEEDEGDDDYIDEPYSDCDGCSDLSYDCSSYCYTFDCYKDEGGCTYMNQEDFCRKYPGAGCSAKDGCHDRRVCQP